MGRYKGQYGCGRKTRNKVKDVILYKGGSSHLEEMLGSQGQGEAPDFWKTSGRDGARDEGHRILKGELENTQNKLDSFSLSSHPPVM